MSAPKPTSSEQISQGKKTQQNKLLVFKFKCWPCGVFGFGDDVLMSSNSIT